MKSYVIWLLLIFAVSGCNDTDDTQHKIKNQLLAGISKNFYGMIDGDSVMQFTLVNGSGAAVKIINYGATITNIYIPGRLGQNADIVLGFDSLAGYLQTGNPYFGCVVGRYANRIARARFVLEGRTYLLASNDGANSLHGGLKGFDKVIWNVKGLEILDHQRSLILEYKSTDGEEGYPGNLTVTCTYQLTNSNELKMIYIATTDKATPVNITNHSYFNLSGGTDSTILNHELMIRSDSFVAVDKNLIPTGKLQYTGEPESKKQPAFTEMDFSSPKKIGKDIDKLKGGYDHNWVLDKNKNEPEMIASLYHAPSGRYMEVFTTQPGIQFYSGNFLDGSLTGKGGMKYEKHSGLCLETQHYPDSPNHPEFPNTILQPGETYNQITVYKFSVK